MSNSSFPPPYAVCLNSKGLSQLNGAYTTAEEALDLPTDSSRTTLPIVFYVRTRDEAVQVYRASALTSVDADLKSELVEDVGKRANGKSDVLSKLDSSKALKFFETLYGHLPAVFVVLDSPYRGIYHDQEWARFAVLHSNEERAAFAIKGRRGALRAAIKVYTSNGRSDGRRDTTGMLVWSHEVPHGQVNGVLPAHSQPLAPGALTTHGVVIPPVGDDVAPIRGPDLCMLAESYFYIWDLDGEKNSPASVTIPAKRMAYQPPSTPSPPATKKQAVPTSSSLLPSADTDWEAPSDEATFGRQHLLPAASTDCVESPTITSSFDSPWVRSMHTPGMSRKIINHYHSVLPLPDIVLLYIHEHHEAKNHLIIASFLQKAMAYNSSVAEVHEKSKVLPSFFTRNQFDFAIRLYFMALTVAM